MDNNFPSNQNKNFYQNYPKQPEQQLNGIQSNYEGYQDPNYQNFAHNYSYPTQQIDPQKNFPTFPQNSIPMNQYVIHNPNQITPLQNYQTPQNPHFLTQTQYQQQNLTNIPRQVNPYPPINFPQNYNLNQIKTYPNPQIQPNFYHNPDNQYKNLAANQNFSNVPFPVKEYNNNPNRSHSSSGTFQKSRIIKSESSDNLKKGTELFIGNLAMESTESELQEFFKDCGEIIEIRIHKQADSKKCYAFVRFQDKDQLKNCLSKNGMILNGRKLKITKSNENSTIFIGNIRKNWMNEEVEIKVKRIFPNCERIEHFPDPSRPKKNRGFCFVVFKNRNEAIRALNYVNSRNGINIDGIPLTCDWADVVDEEDSNSKQIFISGLKENIEEADLRNVFSKYGEITDLVLSKNHKNSKRKDLGFITFSNHTQAKNAIEAFKNQTDTSFDYPVQVCLSFSQQVMQAKKKVKDSRKKVSSAENPAEEFKNEFHSNSINQNFPNPNIGLNNNTQQGNPVENQQVDLKNLISILSNSKNTNPQALTQVMAFAINVLCNNQNGNNLQTGELVGNNNNLLKPAAVNNNQSLMKTNRILNNNYGINKNSLNNLERRKKMKLRVRNKRDLNNRDVNFNPPKDNNNPNDNQ